MYRKMKNQKGQALIELIIFLPMMFMLYSLISGFANAINGSINQQKVTRGYFYYRVQNNSTIPKPEYPASSAPFKTWNKFGMFFIGWKEYFGENQSPMVPCYRVSVPFKPADADKCEESYNKATTQWIRVGTAYGICGATYIKYGDGVAQALDHSAGRMRDVVDPSACLITR